MSGAREGADPNHWQLWWQFNHDRFLPSSQLLEQRSRMTGERDQQLVKTFREVAEPGLKHVLVFGGESELVREVLLTAGRLGDEDALLRTDLLHYARFFLGVQQPHIRVAALEMLGIAGVEDGVDLLATVLADDDAARVVYRTEIPDNERAIAALALGMIGRETESPAVRRSIVLALLAELENDSVDVRAASLLALGQTPLEPCTQASSDGSEGHVCANGMVEAVAFSALDEDEDERVRAHAATSLGRMGGASPDQAFRGRVAEILYYLVHPKSKLDPVVNHGGVIALGLLGANENDEVDSEIRERLRWLLENGDELSRRLAMISLSEIAARSGPSLGLEEGRASKQSDALVRNTLTSEVAQGRRGRRSWASLALGRLGTTSNPRVNASPGFALREGLGRARNVEEAAACSLALGLLGEESPETKTILLERFLRTKGNAYRPYAALSLGLLLVKPAERPLRDELRRDASYALALSLLGDKTVADRLFEELGDAPGESLEQSVEIVDAIGRTKDVRALPRLCQLLQNAELPAALRAHAAAAIGELCDGDPEHWTAVYAENLQYGALFPALRSQERMGLGLLDGR